MTMQVNRQSVFWFFFLFICIASFAKTDRNDSIFFAEIEKNIRADYLRCTNDSSVQNMRSLLLWKRSIDSITQSDQYRSILLDYQKENNIAVNQVSPCQIVMWYLGKKRSRMTADSILDESIRTYNKNIEDSIKFASELFKVKSSPADYSNIPFGITRQSLMYLLLKKGIVYQTDGNDCIYFKDSCNDTLHNIGFFFNKNGIYFKYAIESATAPSDSLDSKIWPAAQSLALYFENKIKAPFKPVHRVGLNDIAPGELSVFTSWKDASTVIYIGLCMFKYRYYAKAVVQSKVISE